MPSFYLEYIASELGVTCVKTAEIEAPDEGYALQIALEKYAKHHSNIVTLEQRTSC